MSVSNPNRDLAIEATDELVKAYLAYRRKIFENPTANILMVEVERFKRDLTATDNEIESLKRKAGGHRLRPGRGARANQVDGDRPAPAAGG